MDQKISNAFMTFYKEAPDHAKAWSEMVSSIAKANVLDQKTTALIYIGILAALGMENGIPFHVSEAKKAGATKEEVIHAALVALPPAGHNATRVLPKIVESYMELDQLVS